MSFLNRIPIQISIIAALVAFLLIADGALRYYVDLDFRVWTAGAAGIFGLVGVILYYVSDGAKQKIVAIMDPVLKSRTLFRSLIILSILILGLNLVFQRVVIVWEGEPIDVLIDGEKRRIGTLTADESKQTADIYGWFLPTKTLYVGPIVKREIFFRPFLLRTATLSKDAVFAGTSDYRITAGLVASALLGTFPNKQLREAESYLASMPEKADLPEIIDVVRRCTVGKNDTTLRNSISVYAGRRPSSTWLPLLWACHHSRNRQFEQGVAVLSETVVMDTPIKETQVLYRAINELHMFNEKRRLGQFDHVLYAQIHVDFDKAIALMKFANGDPYFQIAAPSSHLLKGFSYIAGDDIDRAQSEINIALVSDDPDVKGRAYNGLAYIRGLQGDYDDQKTHLYSALQINPKNAYVLVNLAFLELLVGNEDVARGLFNLIVADKEISSVSEANVDLAKVGLAYLRSESAGGDPGPIAELMSDFGSNNYPGESSPGLRLAYLYKGMGDMFAGNQKYFGTEYFTMALYSKACLAAREVKLRAAGARAEVLYTDSLVSFKKYSVAVNRRWFKTVHQKGFFKSVFELMKIENIQ